MKGKDHKAQELNTTELNTAQAAQGKTQGETDEVAQPDMEELTHEELEQVSGGRGKTGENKVWLM